MSAEKDTKEKWKGNAKYVKSIKIMILCLKLKDNASLTKTWISKNN